MKAAADDLLGRVEADASSASKAAERLRQAEADEPTAAGPGAALELLPDPTGAGPGAASDPPADVVPTTPKARGRGRGRGDPHADVAPTIPKARGRGRGRGSRGGGRGAGQGGGRCGSRARGSGRGTKRKADALGVDAVAGECAVLACEPATAVAAPAVAVAAPAEPPSRPVPSDDDMFADLFEGLLGPECD
jgi:hypothetical protein